MEKRTLLILTCLACLTMEVKAQDWEDDILDAAENMEDQSARNQTWYWAGKKYVYEGEQIWTVLMPELPVYKPLVFKNKKQREKYNRLVANIRRVLPLAQQVNSIIRETYVVLEALPDKKSKEEHVKVIEDELMRRYKPEMKKLTYAQGKLLIKLVDRECNQSGYDVVKAFLGPARATFYQIFAWTFRASLKKKYDAEGDDRLIERICRQLESGVPLE